VETSEAHSVLGVSPGASADDVRAAYLRLIRERHPDRSPSDPDATLQTARLTQAYAVIRSGRDEDETRPDVEMADSDTIAVHAPADEAFGLLFEAAGRVGHVAYFDRQLGMLETIVRFEGGPTCSVLITLQGRAHLTEAFCTMESIEAAETPPIRTVVEAIVHELADSAAET
jgi:hypothetical protein